MNLESDINLTFDNEIKELIVQLEEFRSKNAPKLRSRLIGGLICTPLIVLGFITNIQIIVFILTIPTLLFWASAYSVYAKMTKYLRPRYKNIILNKSIGSIYDDFRYIPRQKIAKSVLVKSMLFPNYINAIEGEDFMQFKIKDTHLMFCETTVYRSKVRIMFYGIFISASFPKYFKSKTFIISKDTSNFMLRIKKMLSKDLERVYLEDPEFEKSFDVISNDQIESRYVLSTSMMRRILDYKNKTKRRVSFSLINNRLYCTVPNYKNLFEPPVFNTLDADWVKRSLEPVLLYAGLIEDLNLDTRIWSKQ
jgi:hypothetical protein